VHDVERGVLVRTLHGAGAARDDGPHMDPRRIGARHAGGPDGDVARSAGASRRAGARVDGNDRDRRPAAVLAYR
jgi:hypothetical protein